MVDVVRDRDKHCQVSSHQYVHRDRGDDWISLEVAHIYPHAYASKMVRGNHIMKLCGYGGVVNRAPNAEGADRSGNAFLLRSDMHQYFDAYHWSIDKVRGELSYNR
ncbi:hypothetical protein BD310DRAFT_832811 [Dichomitus squalens]|uniref:HNH nuclease domain-containing protein n=1 Tax=Dichomitus squalens TaxID=114155 RepID=A0A4Q9PHA3_9APHY|nr:hypothetical protein BD310DRAFT_832811 [Dichomitus squalens]